MTEKSLYDVLGLEPGATEKEIKKAYRKAALNTHPDRAGKGSQEEFERIQKAWEVLSCPEKRSRYDKYGETSSQEALDRLGDFGKFMVSGKHKDHILDPLSELEDLKVNFENKLTVISERLEVVKEDLQKLDDSEEAEEIRNVVNALEILQIGLINAVNQEGALLRQCEDLIRQYTKAKEIVDREPEPQSAVGAPFIQVDLSGYGSATGGGTSGN